jgi:predicted HTH transcriptional regulator
MGTGTADMIRIVKENKLQMPVFEQNEDFKIVINRPSTDQAAMENLQISEEMQVLLTVIQGEMSVKEILESLALKHKGNFRENYLEPALKEGLTKRMFPTKPNHPKQKYRLTKSRKHYKKLKSIFRK